MAMQARSQVDSMGTHASEPRDFGAGTPCNIVAAPAGGTPEQRSVCITWSVELPQERNRAQARDPPSRIWRPDARPQQQLPLLQHIPTEQSSEFEHGSPI
jgi:hypothetical protein